MNVLGLACKLYILVTTTNISFHTTFSADIKSFFSECMLFNQIESVVIQFCYTFAFQMMPFIIKFHGLIMFCSHPFILMRIVQYFQTFPKLNRCIANKLYAIPSFLLY